MLARARRAAAPCESGWSYELKWDGFRALLRCGSNFRVRSRRSWNVTPLLPELAALPVDRIDWSRVVVDSAQVPAVLGAPKPAPARSTGANLAANTI